MLVNLKEIQLPESLTSIGMRAFSNCWSLTNIDNIMSRITVIEANTFEYCKGLPASLTIPNNITAIGDNAFTGCETLTEVTISTGVKTIDHDAFSNCDNLKNVKILSTQLTQIGKGTFCDLPTGSIITVPNETIKNLLVDDGTYNNTNYDSETTTIVVE